MFGVCCLLFVDLGLGIWDLGLGIFDLGLGIWDLGLGIWDLGLGIWDLDSIEYFFLINFLFDFFILHFHNEKINTPLFTLFHN